MSVDRVPHTLLVTGGCGFIGSAVVRRLVVRGDTHVVNVDALTYAGHLASLGPVADAPNHSFEHVDIRDGRAVESLFKRYRPDGVLHLAAESHVDRSIDDAADFVTTNMIGTYMMLEAARRYWSDGAPPGFRFLHVSTDEVYGSLGKEGVFTEASPYEPNSPYAASKASSDMLVRAWHHTYGFPMVLTNCSNNYRPYQYPEKLIPLMIRKALKGEALPVYGDGSNIRDWLHVEDHARALLTVLKHGREGETYLIGARAECTNIALVRLLCGYLDELAPRGDGTAHSEGITFVADRPGHDQRYAIDPGKLEDELGWSPKVPFEEGLRETVRWYLDNAEWCEAVLGGVYAGQRLGMGKTT